MEKEKQQALEAAVLKLKEKNTAYRAYNDIDAFTFHDQPVFTVLDFWRFMYCQLSGENASIAEFLVNKALHVDKAENLNYWTGYEEQNYPQPNLF